jgi:guanosine-3',5'-bis(diphosphate) 3'-pyrophosphohydrolase
LLNNEGVNIADVGVKVANNMADLRLIIEVKDITHLSRILTRIENIPNVLEAQRVKPG